MKKICLSFFLMSYISTQAQVTEVALKDSTFIQAIEIFMDSVTRLHIKEKTIVLVTITNLNVDKVYVPVEDQTYQGVTERRNLLNYVMVVTLQRDAGIFKHYSPSFAFNFRGRMFFVDFRVEDLFELSAQSRKELLKEASKLAGSIKGSSMLARMEIAVKGRDIEVISFGY